MANMLFLLSLIAFLSTTSALTSKDLDARHSGNKDLRILPLGASITYGLQSSDGNGYREDLRQLLSPIPVTYVGSQCSGSMDNGNSEGHPGFLISQMEAVATPDLEDKPNVVLIFVGTNDMKFGNAEKAPDNMKKLVSFLVDKLPGSLIVVSKLILNKDPAVQKRITTFNQQLSQMEKLGNVVIADMSSALSASDLSGDGTHPNDGGYAKMAKVFDTVLIKAEKDGKIPDPKKTTKKLQICKGDSSKAGQFTPKAGNSQIASSASPSSSSSTFSSNGMKAQSQSSSGSSVVSKSTSGASPNVMDSFISASAMKITGSTTSHTSYHKGSTIKGVTRSKSTSCRSKARDAHAVTSASTQKPPTETLASSVNLSASVHIGVPVTQIELHSSSQGGLTHAAPAMTATAGPSSVSTSGGSNIAAYSTIIIPNSSRTLLGSASAQVSANSLQSPADSVAVADGPTPLVSGSSGNDGPSSYTTMAYPYANTTSNASSIILSSGASDMKSDSIFRSMVLALGYYFAL